MIIYELNLKGGSKHYVGVIFYFMCVNIHGMKFTFHFSLFIFHFSLFT